MKKSRIDFYEKNKELFSYFICFFAILMSYIFKVRLNLNIISIKNGMITAIILILFFGMFFIFQDGINSENIIFYIIILGCIMRIGYTLYTPCNIRQHDIGVFDISGNGHAAYIFKLMRGHLPKTNDYQFYHPPFYHFVSAILIKIVSPICKCNSNQSFIEIAKLTSCFSSCGVLLLLRRICKELKLGVKASAVTICMCAFLPNMYLLAGRVNNDGLAFFLSTIIILYSIKWIKDPSVKNIVILAIAYGLGIMTKISVVSLSFITGIFMLVKLYKYIKEKKASILVKQFVCFAVIAFPLGLWYGIRNYILFGQPLNYVYKMDKTTEIYCGNFSFFSRFIKIDIGELINPVYQDLLKNNNIFVSLLRGSVFGEFKFQIKEYSMEIRLMYIFTLILFLIIVFAFIKNIIYHENSFFCVFIPLNIIVCLGLYFMFNVQYPFRCTMDFRYILPVCVLSAILVGKSTEIIKNKFASRIYNISLIGSLSIYSALSMYIFCLR